MRNLLAFLVGAGIVLVLLGGPAVFGFLGEGWLRFGAAVMLGVSGAALVWLEWRDRR